MQQLLTGKKRLPGFGNPIKKEGEIPQGWEKVRLNALVYENKERNYKLHYDKEDVLSVSGDYGIVNQIEFMGRSYAGKSVANYHIVNTNDIVYTKSPLKNNPYGIIKVNKGKPGIVSTLYAVYTCNENISGYYLDYYFQIDDNVNGYLRPLVRKGAKNDMKINNNQVLTGSIVIPNIKEQKSVVSLLSLIDSEIDKAKMHMNYFIEQKKGLMQKLLTGEVRVTI